jgi:hypothetical protein
LKPIQNTGPSRGRSAGAAYLRRTVEELMDLRGDSDQGDGAEKGNDMSPARCLRFRGRRPLGGRPAGGHAALDVDDREGCRDECDARQRERPPRIEFAQS